MQSRSLGIFGAAMAMFAVGAGVTVSAELVEYPVFGAQAVRYIVAAAILVGAVVALRRPLPRPHGRDWLWLIGVAATGLVLFNVAVIRSVEYAEPAAVAILIGAVPLVILIGESLRLRQRPSPRLVAGVALVLVGAALVQGGGRTTIEGFAWAFVALLCEAAFTLLAVPVLGRLGAVGVSIHTCWIAALMLGVLALGIDGSGALPPMHAGAILALAYLAIVQTAIAFSLWYGAVNILGAAMAGLFVGLMPVAAAVSGVIPGLTTLTPAVIGGSLLVGVGIAVGLSARLGPPDSTSGAERDEASALSEHPARHPGPERTERPSWARSGRPRAKARPAVSRRPIPRAGSWRARCGPGSWRARAQDRGALGRRITAYSVWATCRLSRP